MNEKRIHAIVAAASLFGGVLLVRAADVGTAFTYQGYLEKPAGVPVDDLCDFRFNLYDVPIGGVAIGDSPETVLDVSVSGGVFTTLIDFGPAGIDGAARWLEIDIRCPLDGVAFVPLTPRVELTPAPHAVLADQAMRAVEEFRVEAGSTGIASIRFADSPDNKCCIAIDPSGPSGLNISGPSGVRVIRSATAPPGPTLLRFGPTDDCSIGINNIGSSGNDGVEISDQHGAWLTRPLSAGPGPTQLRFGNNPDNICSISVDPTGPSGLRLGDPTGIRILNPIPALPTRMLFGPTDDCSLGIDPGLPGLIGRDPVGLRLVGPGTRILFGPTDDCSIGVNNIGSSGNDGVEIRDVKGAWLRRPSTAPPGPTQLRFGNNPDNICSISVDPTGPSGLTLRDPGGVRIVNPDLVPGPSRLIFGEPDNLCMISMDPSGPPGLTLRDPSGVRLLNPSPLPGPTLLRFGPTDDCSLGIDPLLTGIVERDPVGLRLLSPGSGGGGGAGGRLIFGPTDDCSISVDPGGPSGMRLGDPTGIRVLNPNPALPTRLLFGPTDDCSIGIEPFGAPIQGLCFSDPSGFSFKNGFVAFGVPVATFRIELPNIANPSGQGFANAWINASSRRWKDNIQPIADPLRTLDRLQGVSFVWKPEQGGKKDIGFIAEDVGAVLPEVVSWEKNGTDAKGVDYSRIVPVLVEALKEQQKQIESLDQQRGGVSQRNRELEARLAALEAQVERLLNQGKDGGR